MDSTGECVLEVVRSEGGDGVVRLVRLPDGNGRIDRWDPAASAWVPIPGALFGVVIAGSKLSPAELEARGIPV